MNKISIEKIKEVLEELRDTARAASMNYMNKVSKEDSTPEAEDLRSVLMMSTFHINTLLLQLDGDLPEDIDYPEIGPKIDSLVDKIKKAYQDDSESIQE